MASGRGAAHGAFTHSFRSAIEAGTRRIRQLTSKQAAPDVCPGLLFIIHLQFLTGRIGSRRAGSDTPLRHPTSVAPVDALTGGARQTREVVSGAGSFSSARFTTHR